MWNFNSLGLWSVASNPKHDEFFVDENRDVAQSLVREVSQNSGDAAREGKQAVRLSFRFGTVDRDVFHNRYLRGLRRHLEACDREAALEHLDDQESVPFVAIEDFGTSGLEGDFRSDDDDDSGFIRFWKRYGDSGKRGSSGGRHGVGKSTIATASQLRFFFGLTVRNSDRRKLLYGQAALKFHKIDGENAHFDAYGLFSPAEIDEWPRPFEGEDADRFSTDFRLSRGSEPGLSVVVPYPSRSLTQERLLRAAIEHCFHQILSGRLVVTVDDVLLDRDTIGDVASELLPSLGAALDLSREVTGENPPEPARPIVDHLTENLGRHHFEASTVEAMQRTWNENGIVAAELPIRVRPHNSEEQIGTVRLYLRRAPTAAEARETYVRGRVSVPETPKIVGRSAVALLVADDGAVSRILGDSEGPAHTRWIADRVRGAYRGAGDTLRMVRMALRDFHLLVADSDGQTAIKDALKEFFWTPKMRGEAEERPTTERSAPLIPTTDRSDPFELVRVSGGFVVRRGNDAASSMGATIRVAYDRRRGRPVWSPEDFDLGRSPVTITQSGQGQAEAAGDVLRIADAAPGYQVEVRGFLPSRDLFVQLELTDSETGHAE